MMFIGLARERERERERERVTNYLDLPNNFVTNLQENDAVPAMSSLHLYDMKKSFSQCLSFVC